ncbi:hypothetical protein BDZ91DRAFT_666113 [Kalaharituber pfeilii]|nr:hypothetical protein BDZ91DRAFT_666113 [Kalaharituber pfeilii]
MEFDVSYSLENEQQFWDELDEIVNSPCRTTQLVENNLRAYLGFVTDFQDEYLKSASDWARCSFSFLGSPMFESHKEYIRSRLIERLQLEESNPAIYLISTVLLFDGRQNQETFERMQGEGLFRRLLTLITMKKQQEDKECRNRLLETLYEMSRVQRLRWEDLAAIDDAFITYLFELVEEQAELEDPYHYVIIRALLVLNEQYMVSALAPSTESDKGSGAHDLLTNKVIKTLCFKGDVYKTFGENIILLLNRETETSLQLLILKVIYLLCTTVATYEYFYRNDLYVLVDVVIRNLLDLPDDAESLRHTYLRVLYPLLAHTQLRNPPFYKSSELLMLFNTLASIRYNHFQPVDETTIRLVTRCSNVPWLAEEAKSSAAAARLGMNLEEGLRSSVEVAAVAEKPGVMAPSRSRAASGAPSAAHTVNARPPPPPPPKLPPHAHILPPSQPSSPPPPQPPPPPAQRKAKVPPPPPRPRVSPPVSGSSSPAAPTSMPRIARSATQPISGSKGLKPPAPPPQE